MRKISEIAEHSVYHPGLQTGWILDAGANRGRFGNEVAQKFPVSVISLEANPELAVALHDGGSHVTACALGSKDGIVELNVGTNDEASSIRLPLASGAHLKVKNTLRVPMKSLVTVMAEEGIAHFCCVKLDIEGAEIEVLTSLAGMAARISPQWTVEFHDGNDLKLCTTDEVDNAISSMTSNGFGVLVRNWPDRTNVLFLDRGALSIGSVEWFGLKLRYQYLAILWRQLLAIRKHLLRQTAIVFNG